MIGTKLAHYEITQHLGSGGMGDVYQATDSKLGRSVAIKFLPKAFSHDNERVARFQREARTSELQSRVDLVCRLLLEKKKKKKNQLQMKRTPKVANTVTSVSRMQSTDR